MKEEDMDKSKQVKDMSIYEASDYWDKHVFTEFEDVEKVKNISFSFISKKYVGVDVGLYLQIKTIAKKCILQ